jgi:hypothetical protein
MQLKTNSALVNSFSSLKPAKLRLPFTFGIFLRGNCVTKLHHNKIKGRNHLYCCVTTETTFPIQPNKCKPFNRYLSSGERIYRGLFVSAQSLQSTCWDCTFKRAKILPLHVSNSSFSNHPNILILHNRCI